MLNYDKRPIGVFDSGMGGISVLGEMLTVLPGEKYIYMADSGNAPYGTKDSNHVGELSVNIARKLYDRGIKALVVACNTATSVAINQIRASIDIPVIGMEPALKPAVEMGKTGSIVVMATPLTLKEEKFNSLYRKYGKDASIIPIPCPGLVELIESEASPDEVRSYLKDLFAGIAAQDISSVVLGCTHYTFVKNEISDVIGSGISIVDGNRGTVRHLERILQSAGLTAPVSDARQTPEVEFITSGDPAKILPACRRFLKKALEIAAIC